MAKHKDLGVKHAKHRPGCVTRHVSTYDASDSCSHRYHAAKRARAERRIDYTNAQAQAKCAWKDTDKNRKTLATFLKQGKITGPPSARGGKLHIAVEPFSTVWWPWLNNAHHIIPRSVLADALEEIARSAEDHWERAFDVMIQGLLEEQYNLNDVPNMIMLPVDEADGAAMGLPAHLSARKRDHPAYSKQVRKVVHAVLQMHYEDLVAAIKAAKHAEEDRPPAVKAVLEEISNITYEQILLKAAASRAAGQADVTLDSLTDGLYK